MSSYVCTPKHFNSIEFSLVKLFVERGQGISFPYSLKANYPNLYSGDDSYAAKARKEIYDTIDELRRLNVLAVTLQYKSHFVGVLDAELKTQTDYLLENKKDKKDLTKLGLYNALNCLSYQIELPEVTEIRPLSTSEEKAVDFLEVIINALAKNICSGLPDDKTNTWSIE